MTEKKIKIINIAKDFSPFPIGRDNNDSPYNGEAFRNNILIPALKEYDEIQINLDGPKGYGSSFLEEAFGGLIRVAGYDANSLKKTIKFLYSDPINQLYEKEAWEYIDEA